MPLLRRCFSNILVYSAKIILPTERGRTPSEFCQIVFLHMGKTLMVTATNKQSNFNKYADVFAEMMDSFVFLPDTRTDTSGNRSSSADYEDLGPPPVEVDSWQDLRRRGGVRSRR